MGEYILSLLSLFCLFCWLLPKVGAFPPQYLRNTQRESVTIISLVTVVHTSHLKVALVAVISTLHSWGCWPIGSSCLAANRVLFQHFHLSAGGLNILPNYYTPHYTLCVMWWLPGEKFVFDEVIFRLLFISPNWPTCQVTALTLGHQTWDLAGSYPVFFIYLRRQFFSFLLSNPLDKQGISALLTSVTHLPPHNIEAEIRNATQKSSLFGKLLSAAPASAIFNDKDRFES